MNLLDYFYIDYTAGVIFFVIALTWWVLHTCLFSPMLERLFKRDNRITLLADQVREIKVKLNQTAETHNAAKTAVDREAVALLNDYKKQAAQQHNNILATGRLKMGHHVFKGRAALEVVKHNTQSELILHAQDISGVLRAKWEDINDK